MSRTSSASDATYRRGLTLRSVTSTGGSFRFGCHICRRGMPRGRSSGRGGGLHAVGAHPADRIGGGGGRQHVSTKKKDVTSTKNALRSAQLEKRELLLFRKFGYGPRLFERYYRGQDLAAAEELEALATANASALPITFRLHRSDPRAAELVNRLESLARRDLVRPLPWMAHGMGWQALPVTRDADDDSAAAQASTRRPTLHPAVAKIVDEGVHAGLLARQEAVSMLPVLTLAPTLCAGARVLDVCAAPGNKTMQLLEIVSPSTGSDGAKAAGLVVANDAHLGRVNTLRAAIERHARSHREMSSLVVTCAMGQDLPAPTFTHRDDDDDASGARSVTSGYDAVLTDVPCSGDGTARKDPDVLRRWHPGVGNALHLTQVAVARRAASLVRPGGALLYSTCSLNPVEDEAVVAAILEGPGGEEFEIEEGAVDRGAPGIKYRPGVQTWRVAEHVTRESGDDDSRLDRFDSDSEDDEDEVTLRWYGTYEDAVDAKMPSASPTMWPRPQHHERGGRDLHLERCARFLPHDQDTGGFFVALLRRRLSKHRDESHVCDMRESRRAAVERASAAARARAASDLADPVRPLPPGEAGAIASRLGLDAASRRRLWLGGEGAVTLSPSAAANVSDLGAVAVAAAGVIALVPRVSAWDEEAANLELSNAASFPYDFTAAGAEALAGSATRRRLRVSPTDLQAMLSARASGDDVRQENDSRNSRRDAFVALTGEEMSDGTRARWKKRTFDGAAMFVLTRKGKNGPEVVFAVPGRCSEEGVTISPEMTKAQAKRALSRLGEVAGAKRRRT